MKLKLTFLSLFLLSWSTMLSGQTPFVCKGQYFLSLSTSTSANSGLFMVDIDPQTGGAVFNTLAASLGATVNAMGYRSTDNFIYGINPTPTSLHLYRVGSDGMAVDLGIPNGMIAEGNYYYAGDVTPDGNYLILIGQFSVLNQEAIIAMVDLNAPDFQVTSIVVPNTFPGIYDIAFDPTSGDLYGFSTGASRLVRIDIDGESISSTFLIQPQVGQLGALFFDVSGNLFGYGRINGNSTLVAVDKTTGAMTAVAGGPPSGGEDGCSCPYTVDLKKVVSTSLALPCTEVIYTFSINNASGVIQTGLHLMDIMPDNFTVLEIISNPFGGVEVIDGRYLSINGMTVPTGNNTIQVLVEIGPEALGHYQNQALLSGLPFALGGETVSDNPYTYLPLDSTPIEIVPLDITFVEAEYAICPGEEVAVDVSLYGVEYLWEDGSDIPARIFNEAGSYSVTVSSGCDQVIANFEVTLTVEYYHKNVAYVFCEENGMLTIDVSRPGATYQWDDGAEGSSKVFTEVGDYTVVIIDGCEEVTIDYSIVSSGYYLNILADELTVELGEGVHLSATYDAGDGAPQFEWNPPVSADFSCVDCLDPFITPTETYIYTLVMTIEECIYTDEVLVHVVKNRALFIPNVISPNDDGINDFFYVQSPRNNVRIRKMTIFDRWGNKVYLGNNLAVNQPSMGWDGNHNGQPVRLGVFTYMIEFEFIDGAIILESGDVTVIR